MSELLDSFKLLDGKTINVYEADLMGEYDQLEGILLKATDGQMLCLAYNENDETIVTTTDFYGFSASWSGLHQMVYVCDLEDNVIFTIQSDDLQPAIVKNLPTMTQKAIRHWVFTTYKDILVDLDIQCP